jgi:type II secretory pathway predicted ATPase ExeA
MYKHFFGLRENPFNVNPDPRFLFLTPQTQEALDDLTYGIQARKGLILLTGEVGTGKTTLINRVLDWLRQQKTPTAFIFNSHLETSHLFDFILADFGVPFDSRLKGNVLMRLNQWLFERYRAGETPVLIVDEAQGLPNHVLEEIRMLLNLETPSEKLLQIVLAGQPELEARLKQPALRQVKQRITLRCKTAALTLQETHDYIQARLHIAGANGRPIFASQAMDAVYFYSRGIQRVINLLCEHSLINAYVDHVRPVPAPIVEDIAREFQFDDIKPVAPFKDSRNTLDSDLIAMQSRVMNGLSSLTAKVELALEEHTSALTTAISAPPAAAETALTPFKLFAPAVLTCQHIQDLEGSAESFSAPGVQTAVTTVPGPRRVETSRPSELTEFFNELVNQFRSGLPMKSSVVMLPPLPLGVEAHWRFDQLPASGRGQVSGRQEPTHSPTKVDAAKSGALCSNLTKTFAPRLFLLRWGTRWRDRIFSTVTSPDWEQEAASLPEPPKQSVHPVRAWYRRCMAWKNNCLSFAGSIDWPRRKAFLYRWLRQPMDPTQWRLPDLRLTETRRRFNYKKT